MDRDSLAARGRFHSDHRRPKRAQWRLYDCAFPELARIRLLGRGHRRTTQTGRDLSDTVEQAK